MTRRVLVLRPEPGAGATAKRARALGLDPVTAPLFTLSALDWAAPDPGEIDAILLTSANAARLAGPKLAAFAHLPCQTVGEATATAAREAGFTDVRTGPADAAAALAALAGYPRILHPCGREHIPLPVDQRPVYAADAIASLGAEARAALAQGALVLLHSPRAAATFAALVDAAGLARGGIALAAISPAAAVAAGTGWRSVASAARPRDEALLELAAELCQKTQR